jgi:hypothetical protein
MKLLRLTAVTLLFLGNYTFGQSKIDSTLKPEESTYYDGPVNTVFEPGFILRTRSKNYYEISGKKKYANKVANSEIKVYREKKRKYLLVIQGIEDPISASKLQDVIESNIDGDFRGWDGTTSFKLMNGDVWVQDEIKTLFSSAIFRPVVFIYQGSDGTYKMKVAGVEETVQVKKK